MNGAVEAAAEALRAGALVLMPTETVYGLAADATRADAVARIFEAKGRPRFNPLIAHVADRASGSDTMAWAAARSAAWAIRGWERGRPLAWKMRARSSARGASARRP